MNYRNPVVEILLQKNRQIFLARVLLFFNAPLKRYPKFGVWSYLIRSTDGVIVLDTGPVHTSIVSLRPKKSHNADIILDTVRMLFPKFPIKEILLSHYHYDHSESAPELQDKSYHAFGITPPIRIHAKDFEEKIFLKAKRHSLTKVFLKTGYRNWTLGKFLKDKEQLEGTDFSVMHTPGHTSGCIGLVSEKQKIIISGWYVKKNYDPILEPLGKYFIDEDSIEFPVTYKKIRRPGFTSYYFHPLLHYFSKRPEGQQE